MLRRPLQYHGGNSQIGGTDIIIFMSEAKKADTSHEDSQHSLFSESNIWVKLQQIIYTALVILMDSYIFTTLKVGVLLLSFCLLRGKPASCCRSPTGRLKIQNIQISLSKVMGELGGYDSSTQHHHLSVNDCDCHGQ